MHWTRPVRQAFTGAGARSSASLPFSHIQVTGLPKTALPQDVRRLVQTRKLENVSGIFMDYDRFRPTGTAYLSLSSPNSMTRNLRMLNKATMASLSLRATAVPNPFSVGRTRGTVGRKEAANKGLVDGNGPNGGTSGQGKNVIMWGLPGKLPPDGLRNYLRTFQLSETSSQESIVKIEPEKLSLTSRHLVRCSTPSEAYRLVRRLHMTYFSEPVYGGRYLLGARVVS
ncbi:hypothetical protein BDM02DRAFT_3110627 [Thelephora ganbajun]|uniref:Uncharacterized protein n=1 Tax=Thelephora ganbajun TaxID=370292 RepID=A0ACB6ZPE8_THEGA|nr:hypothetical protein BDM02DRAFT_3110627 [Thelephora ganbajun]